MTRPSELRRHAGSPAPGEQTGAFELPESPGLTGASVPAGLSELAAAIAEAGGRHRTATAFVEATLRAAILSGRLAGGTPLRQEDLAAAFGVSRMPVRGALRQRGAQALLDFV